MRFVITYVNITEEKHYHYVIVILNIGLSIYIIVTLLALCNYLALRPFAQSSNILRIATEVAVLQNITFLQKIWTS